MGRNWRNHYMRLYKIRSDGTEMQKLNDEKCFDIEVQSGWVYNCNSQNRKHCKIRTDGKEQQLPWPMKSVSN